MDDYHNEKSHPFFSIHFSSSGHLKKHRWMDGWMDDYHIEKSHPLSSFKFL
jgi:hypothetical protein